MRIRLVRNEPMAFGGGLAHYGKFAGVKNYLALVGKKDTYPAGTGSSRAVSVRKDADVIHRCIIQALLPLIDDLQFTT